MNHDTFDPNSLPSPRDYIEQQKRDLLGQAIERAGIPESLREQVRGIIQEIQRGDDGEKYVIAFHENEMQRILEALQRGLDSGDCVQEPEAMRTWIRQSIDGILKRRTLSRE